GWQEDSGLDLIPFIVNYQKKGIKYVICTDIAKDGMLEGASSDLYKRILTRIPDINLIASGGVSNVNDIHELNAIGCDGAIIGKAIYENKISLRELEQFIINN
ncbi:MAG: 1-(5-phosphoribosyl)-5-[(5-phosphoribosylamino)methylideneamino]imidazole-4-carboxamide isomerase, partial [Flavobacteriaceae bacterium]